MCRTMIPLVGLLLSLVVGCGKAPTAERIRKIKNGRATVYIIEVKHSPDCIRGALGVTKGKVQYRGRGYGWYILPDAETLDNWDLQKQLYRWQQQFDCLEAMKKDGVVSITSASKGEVDVRRTGLK